MSVADLSRSIDFYTKALHFRIITADRSRAVLKLGDERIILNQPYLLGRRIPPKLPANDHSFQHLAIVVRDIDLATKRLTSSKVRIVSKGVQRLPDSNFDAAGIRALYFRDPDNHFLELIQFPSNKGESRWHSHGAPLFEGIDHSALVVRDMKASLSFYRDKLGFTVSGNSFNHGTEQERLSGVLGARVRITSLRGAKGPGLELLQYEEPGTKETLPRPAAENDLAYWRVHLRSTSGASALKQIDPDGHVVALQRIAFLPAHLFYALEALRRHWPLYLMEGAELGIFMAVALLLALGLDYPHSVLHTTISSAFLRRFLFGLFIGLTVVLLIYSDWGRRSGAQFNPSVTLGMLYLWRIQPWDALFYMMAQFLGGWIGVILVARCFPKSSAHADVNYVVTEPGKQGVAVAFVAEFLISFILMSTLRLVYQSDFLNPYMGYFAGVLLCAYITFESPYSGMSLNPARSVASALPSGNWTSIWIYFVAPTLAMLLAVSLTG